MSGPSSASPRIFEAMPEAASPPQPGAASPRSARDATRGMNISRASPAELRSASLLPYEIVRIESMQVVKLDWVVVARDLWHWASPIEAKLCGGQEVALVGAGNSAAQAAVYLASHVKKVWLLARRISLEETMSHYLVERIKAQPNIEVVTRSEVTALEGCEGNLESLRWRRCSPNEETTRAISHLFLFIGAEPNTDWLAQCDVALDEKGFVRTGDVGGAKSHALETNRSGVFAIGDVRSGSVKRVAAAVGEGAQVVSALHAYLARSGSAAASAAAIART